MSLRVVGGFILSAALVSVAACGSSSPESKPASRVYFAEPANGAMVKSPVHLVFASDQFTIAAVPQGEVKEVRANTGHYHLGTDTKCLAPGTVIPKADPWIHFGMGNNTIEMQLTPGPHTLVLQAGDDKHTTITGLCETISVNVTGE
ncbi:MAG TPA: DUF4399 domain-containing protein [Vicinamibacterales bacterium]|nr:DUF4399 domain-containing protein [Vicinamibacterales bacterium]